MHPIGPIARLLSVHRGPMKDEERRDEIVYTHLSSSSTAYRSRGESDVFVVCFCITFTEIMITGRHHVKGLVKIPNGLGQCFSLRGAYVGTVHARQVQAYVSALLVLIPTATNGCILRRTSRE